MGSFSKKISRVTMFSENFFQKKVMCCQRKKLKAEIIANYLLQFGCTHRLHTFFISVSASKTGKTSCFQPLGSFLMSTVKQPFCRYAQKRHSRFFKKNSKLQCFSDWLLRGVKNVYHVFHRQNVNASCFGFLHVWSKFNVLVQFAKKLPKTSFKLTRTFTCCF